MEVLKSLEGALTEAQDELVSAEMALTEATARAEMARNEAAKLQAAVAALNGDEPPPATQKAERKPVSELSPEEFDAQRKKRQRKKRAEERANSPYAGMKCTGCGAEGTLVDSFITAPSGAPVKMISCTSCGNQIIN